LEGVTLRCFTVFVISDDVSCNDDAENSGLIGGSTVDSDNNDALVRIYSSSILNENNGSVGSDDTARDDGRESSVVLEGYNKDKVSGGSGEELGTDFCSWGRFVDDMVRLH
jgi:hypothetical protein